ncbi:MAG: S8 family serine peptidase [Pyrinomonadaceae bacterium]
MSVSPSEPQATHTSRRRGSLTLLLAFLLLTAGLPVASRGQQAEDAQAQEEPTFGRDSAPAGKKGGAEFVPGQVLVRFRTDTAAKRAEIAPAALRAIDGEELSVRVSRFGGSDLIKGLRLAQVDADKTLEAVAALAARPDVLYAEPDYLVREAALPNDPRFPEMYGLKNTGQSGGTVGSDIDAELAWNITQGSHDVVIGVVDSGIDINHPDLQPNIWTNPGETPGDGVDNDGNGRIDDINGWDFHGNNNVVFDSATIDDHGTHVAGTIGAAGNNGVGVTGVNWRVKLMSLKFLGNDDGTGPTSAAIAAINYAVDMRLNRGVNIRALNNSWGGSNLSQSLLNAITSANNAGILFVAAAGNDGTDNDTAPHYPSNYDVPNIIAVANTNRFDSLSSSSSFGARSVHIGAPGSSILSTTPNNTYSVFSGTSMSTPHVTGTAALMLAANPNITLAQLRGALLYSGDAIGALDGKAFTQRRLNAYNALLSAAENDTTPPAALTNLSFVSQNGRTVNLSWVAPGDDGNAGQSALYEVSFTSNTDGTSRLVKTLVPGPAGAAESRSIDVPYRQTSGSLKIRAIDNLGNAGPETSIGVTVDLAAADPYVTSLSPHNGLSPLGTPQNFRDDDAYRTYTLPFAFPFYGQQATTAVISTNGTLYFQPQSTLPRIAPPEDNGDSSSSLGGLEGFRMIAGLWDDIRTDSAGGDVFVNSSDPDRAIFRWEGRVFASATNPDAGAPVQFEIELNRDGTIQTRYGAGNTGITPVVGIGGGELGSSYVINSHTRPLPNGNLTNAQTVTFAPRPAAPPSPVVQFSAATAGFSESAINTASLTITRGGDTSGTSTVFYQTIDNSAAVRCDDTTTLPGVAFARCDYATSVDTVTFAPGATTAQITIPLIDDAHVEGNETFQVQLSNPSASTTLGANASVTVTLTDNDVAGAANPIDTHTFFVRQQYLDFLSREPEPDGFQSWLDTLNGCPDPFNSDRNSQSARCDRNVVSSSFFRSQEFELKGLYVFMFYRVALHERPEYAAVISDMRQVTGQSTAEVNQRRAQFAAGFTQRPEFTNRYGGLSEQAFVAALLGQYNAAQITTEDPANPDGTEQVTLTREQLVSGLTSGALSRAQVLRAVVQSTEVNGAEFNGAFVAMQYYGYLRRTPEAEGYQGWLDYLTRNPTDFRTMVNGFMNSDEYRLRFGRP